MVKPDGVDVAAVVVSVSPPADVGVEVYIHVVEGVVVKDTAEVSTASEASVVEV